MGSDLMVLMVFCARLLFARCTEQRYNHSLKCLCENETLPSSYLLLERLALIPKLSALQ